MVQIEDVIAYAKERLDKFQWKTFAGGFLCGCVLVYAAMSTGRSTDHTGTTISTITGQQQQAASQVGAAMSANQSAAESIGSAGGTIADVSGRINQSTEIARQSADRISYIKQLAEECRSLAASNGAILRGLGGADSGRAQTGQKSAE